MTIYLKANGYRRAPLFSALISMFTVLSVMTYTFHTSKMAKNIGQKFDDLKPILHIILIVKPLFQKSS